MHDTSRATVASGQCALPGGLTPKVYRGRRETTRWIEHLSALPSTWTESGRFCRIGGRGVGPGRRPVAGAGAAFCYILYYFMLHYNI